MMNSRYDLHIHSIHSDGNASVQEIAKRATTIGLRTIAVTDHFWPSLGSKHGGRSIINNRRQEIVSARMDFSELSILEGVEVDIQADGTLAPVAGGLEQFSVIIGSFHWVSDSTQWISTLSKAARNKQFQILGHWDGYLSSYREEDGDMAAKILSEAGIAIELNERYSMEHVHFLEKAKEQDCIFSLGSDSHSVETIGQLDYVRKLVADFDLNVVEPEYFIEQRRRKC
jgi:histidinol phosphatase-like PHP family hydrolase